MAERTKAVVLKTIVAVSRHRGFESLSLRIQVFNVRSVIAKQSNTWGGARVDDWSRLLSGCTFTGTAGSNPVLPAR